jgi:hypothetical protein
MTEKVAEMTVDELRQTIREVVEEVIAEETELNPDFATELESRIASDQFLTHEEVWAKK